MSDGVTWSHLGEIKKSMDTLNGTIKKSINSTNRSNFIMIVLTIAILILTFIMVQQQMSLS